jgi:hypothetical protein
MSLDRLQAALSIENALEMGRAVPVKNDPPTIVFTPRTGVLVSIDGNPAVAQHTGHLARARHQLSRAHPAG